MRRREFFGMVGCAAVWPLAARAQQPTVPVIGFLHSGWLNAYVSQMSTFRQRLEEAGYIEGQNIQVEYRWAEDQIARLPVFAAELVSRHVSVIAAGGSPASALAAKSATDTIPILFMNAADPVAIGLVTNFSRPGGNVTGATLLSAELVSKRLGTLHDLLPSITKIAVLINPTRPGVDAQKAQVQAAAHALGLTLDTLEASSERGLEPVFRAAVARQNGALLISPDALFLDRRVEIANLAIHYKIPTMYELRQFVDAGGFISYGASALDMYRQAATLIGEILMGKKPVDLPVLQPTKFELAINMKTASALGIEVPSSMQLLADEVIE